MYLLGRAIPNESLSVILAPKEFSNCGDPSMLTYTNWNALNALLAVTMLASWAPLAHGQRPIVRPNMRPVAAIAPPTAYRGGVVPGGCVDYRAGYRRAAGITPCFPGGSYSPNSDPHRGYQSGPADAGGDAGQAMISVEQAMQMREQYRQMKIDTRRRMFDEWLYERANTPTLEDDLVDHDDLNLARGDVAGRRSSPACTGRTRTCMTWTGEAIRNSPSTSAASTPP
jgi:hypothetical protein